MPSESSRHLQAFDEGLEALGYTERQNIAIERRYGDFKAERLPESASEPIKPKVDVIVAWRTPVALATQQAISTIPCGQKMRIANSLPKSHRGENDTKFFAFQFLPLST